jgi:hypothetical protein
MHKKGFFSIFFLCFILLLIIESGLVIFIAGPMIMAVASTFIGVMVFLLLFIGINALISWLIAKTIVNRKNKV